MIQSFTIDLIIPSSKQNNFARVQTKILACVAMKLFFIIYIFSAKSQMIHWNKNEFIRRTVALDFSVLSNIKGQIFQTLLHLTYFAFSLFEPLIYNPLGTKGLNQRTRRLPVTPTFVRGLRGAVDEYVRRVDDVRAFEGRPSTRKVTLANGIKRKRLNGRADERLCKIDRANRRRSVTEQSVG